MKASINHDSSHRRCHLPLGYPHTLYVHNGGREVRQDEKLDGQSEDEAQADIMEDMGNDPEQEPDANNQADPPTNRSEEVGAPADGQPHHAAAEGAPCADRAVSCINAKCFAIVLSSGPKRIYYEFCFPEENIL